ncbi:binding-protein-dependent transport systems inner membrane component [Kribbella flavida DSM 17836]|uniref:Binding-protein-dependent transport systems inner membrane component n=1 Tax=Kribbella flavida (strain DSM 17836 / JCM 10339 / NBRC 14399) TaxID=479435 RepID=D2Q0N3_KRIFD|nr:sugar ABC transporter permease [Kribbella flavida]ADB33833.1 binding-protein-dependent transport systems inner membrane component [Kribbella flavida DSM 17836]
MAVSNAVSAPAVTATTKDPAGRPPNRYRRALPQYAAISPFFILFAIFGAFPVLFSIWLSLHSWDGIGAMQWVGLEQYSYLLSDPKFWAAITNTLIIWVLSTVPMLLLALVIANALHNATRFRSFYRIAYFIPNITSVVAVTMVFGSIFSNNFGLLNAFLQSVGLNKIEWLSQPWGIKVAIATIVTWRWVGYNAIIFLAGLQAIPSDVYEAAKVDGASPRQTFWRVTVPMLRPVILFAAITSTIGGLQIFTESQVLLGNSGGPGGAGTTIVSYLYQNAFGANQFGYGAAIGWALFILIVLFSIINWRLIGGDENDRLTSRLRRRAGKEQTDER